MDTCICRCHIIDGIRTLHHKPCCHLVHRQYLNQDKIIDPVLLTKFQEEYDAYKKSTDNPGAEQKDPNSI